MAVIICPLFVREEPSMVRALSLLLGGKRQGVAAAERGAIVSPTSSVTAAPEV